MFDRKLKIGDYIYTPTGRICRITKINKLTYSYTDITSLCICTGTVPFDGIRKSTRYYNLEEFFYCDDVQGKALEAAFKKYKTNIHINKSLEEIKDYLNKNKELLEKLEEEIECLQQ